MPETPSLVKCFIHPAVSVLEQENHLPFTRLLLPPSRYFSFSFSSSARSTPGGGKKLPQGLIFLIPQKKPQG